MKFEKWFKKNFGDNFGACNADEALELGWYACKKEVLKLIKKESSANSVCSVISKIEDKI